jgi:prepilin-type N-terminal cleavage/methylation domain-containing protein
MRTLKRLRGFTLIEILIVVSIIAVIASMILAGVSLARKQANIAIARSFISSLQGQLEAYYRDTGKYPGEEFKDGENAFPALFEALFGERPPKGKGGPSAPYMKLKEDDVLVFDPDQGDEGTYRVAERDEIYDPNVKKFIRDPFGQPYVYHENASRPNKKYMHSRKADIYSLGHDKIDQTLEGEKGDDIGSW